MGSQTENQKPQRPRKRTIPLITRCPDCGEPMAAYTITRHVPGCSRDWLRGVS